MLLNSQFYLLAQCSWLDDSPKSGLFKIYGVYSPFVKHFLHTEHSRGINYRTKTAWDRLLQLSNRQFTWLLFVHNGEEFLKRKIDSAARNVSKFLSQLKLLTRRFAQAKEIYCTTQGRMLNAHKITMLENSRFRSNFTQSKLQ